MPGAVTFLRRVDQSERVIFFLIFTPGALAFWDAGKLALITSLLEVAYAARRAALATGLNINNEKVVLRLCVRFLFCVFPELHWLRQELAGERNPRGK